MEEMKFTLPTHAAEPPQPPPALDHWRSVLDNVFIEFLASLFIVTSAVMYAGVKARPEDALFPDPWTQLITAGVLCAAMLCLKDGDGFFPDTTPTVTAMLWCVGGYDNWIQPCARMVGQCGGLGIAVWMFHGVRVPAFVPMGRTHAELFVFEMMGTAIEHMGAVYLFIPMLPALGHGRVRPKHHYETEPPQLGEVMHASVAFAGIHWTLRLCFLSEMNPLVTVTRACVWGQGWDEAMMMLWGQGVGVLVALIYIAKYYHPRKQPAPRARH